MEGKWYLYDSIAPERCLLLENFDGEGQEVYFIFLSPVFHTWSYSWFVVGSDCLLVVMHSDVISL